MPTEHEYKYVLNPECMFEIDDILKGEYLLIEQGYLAFSKGTTLRIRKIRKPEKKVKWFFTFKQNVGGRIIEIETKLDSRDGKDLWENCIGKIKKRRYPYDNHVGKWEIDFFEDSTTEVYFSVAEIELEEGAPRPALEQVPEFVKHNIVYEVDLTDERFSNRKLGDVAYAKALYKKIIEKEEHNE